MDIQELIEKTERNNIMIKQLIDELNLTRKALLICASKYGYELDKDYEYEPDTEEEATATSIYNQYTRPKILARKMLKIAKTNNYDLQTNVTLKYWKSEITEKI